MGRPDSRRIRLRADIERLGSAGFDAAELSLGAARLLHRVVGFESSCWHPIDPATSMLTGAIRDGFAPDPQFPRYEYAVPDVNKFAHLARQRRTAGILGQATAGDPDRSARYRDLLRPLGIGAELRAAFVVDGQCWGACSLYRPAGAPDFNDADADVMVELSPALGDGFRRATLIASGRVADAGPGLVILDANDGIRTVTDAALRLLADLVDVSSVASERLPAPVYAAAAQARARPEAGHQDASARIHAPIRSGGWLVLDATVLSSPGGWTAVIVQRAGGDDVAPLMARAYGLSRRERDVVELILDGATTGEVAASLRLSPLTIQDYLKSIFLKVGVHSRTELGQRLAAATARPAPGGRVVD